jgi:hypothetical protein
MIVDTIRKTHSKAFPNGSLGMLISAIKLVAKHVPTKTRDLLATNWMNDKSKAVKTKLVTYYLVNCYVVFSSSFKGGVEPAPASI